jgi:hypothetical protein
LLNDLVRGRLEEAIQMWKKVLNALLESFAMTDPVACMYLMAARRQAELEAEATPYAAPTRYLTYRPIDSSLGRREGTSA